MKFPFSQRVKDTLSDGFLPFLEMSARAQASVEFLIYRAKGYTELQTEQTDLRKQLSELSTRMAQVAELERENRNLRAMLDFKNRSEFKLVSAKVIGRDPSNWWNTILIDRGSADRVERDMPVITVEGLVGKIIEVTTNNSRVLLLIDENCKISAWLQDSRQYGIVQGNALAGGGDFACKMLYLDRSTEIKPHDKVLTSGLGGIFPKGILVGTVTSVPQSPSEAQKSNLYQEIRIRPTVDLARIEEVFIAVGEKDKSNRAATENRGDKK
jgi:rod shape-determining protein MreC